MPMKIALIAPPYPLTEAPSPPLGICYVAAACEAAGAEVRIFDYIVSLYTPEKLRRQLDEFCPDVVGATAVTLNFPDAAAILQTAKAHQPEIVTIMGGPHVTFQVEETLQQYPEIDVIFMGESENTLERWLPVLRHRHAWGSIAGIAFRNGKQIVNTGPVELISDLARLPLPSRHLLPLSRYQALGFPVSIITSRGCPNKCIFCVGRRMVGARVRYRSPKRVVDEIEFLVNAGFTRLNFADDLFTANKNHVRAICNLIVKRKISFGWSAFARVDTVNEEVLQLMKEAGCDSVSFGIESGNPAMLRVIRKRITLDQARQAAAMCKAVGMRPHASFIVGLPGESLRTLADTLAFARELNIEHGFHFLTPFPGTDVYESTDYDLEILTTDWRRYDANTAIVRTSKIAPEEIENFVTEAYRPLTDKWTDIKKRYAEGECTESECLEVESETRLNLVFQILSGDLIEEFGEFPADEPDPVAALAGRIAGKTATDVDFVARYLQWWLHKEYLAFTEENGFIRCDWTTTAFAPDGAAVQQSGKTAKAEPLARAS